MELCSPRGRLGGIGKKQRTRAVEGVVAPPATCKKLTLLQLKDASERCQVAAKGRRDKVAELLRAAHPGKQLVTADEVWVGVKAAKKEAGLPIGAHRISSAISKSAVSFCVLLHSTCTGQEQTARLEAAKERAELLGSVQHTRVARLRGAYPVTLARQVAEMWRQQGRRKQSEHRQEMVSKADVMG